MARVLIIEDDVTFSQILEAFLKRNDYEVSVAHTVKDGLNALEQQYVDLVLLDFRLPDGTGMDVLTHINQREAQLSVIIMTSFNDIRTAVKAIRSGAYEYITKPVNPDELLLILKESLSIQKKDDNPAQPDFIIGNSPDAEELAKHIRLVAPTDMSVIIQGESGTGKEVAARNIHLLSKRADKPFVAIDCGALTADLAASELFGHIKGAFTGALTDKKGQFEAADGGTLFLDEVGNLSYEVQVKLLRAIQERIIQPVGSNRNIKVNVRIITATNDDLPTIVREGKFREDLYHRLNEFKIRVPSLKERTEDLDLFVHHFIARANKELGKQVKGLSAEVAQLFRRYDWPGNIRELKNILRRAVLLSPSPYIERDALPDEMIPAVEQHDIGSDLKAIQALTEKEQIEKVLREVKYNKSKAAKLLNIDRTTLYYKMSKYNIDG